MNCRPVGVLVMEDDGGQDEKIVAVPSDSISQRYVGIRNYTDLPEITQNQVRHFFEHYKDLEDGKWVRIDGWRDSATARRMIQEAMVRLEKQQAA